MHHHFANNQRPTILEDQAYSQARQHFAEHSNQLSASHDTMRQLEKNLPAVAATLKEAASQAVLRGDAIQTTDGGQWRKAVALPDNHCACFRQTNSGAAFAVVEHQSKTGTNEIINQGSNAADVVQAFAAEQKRTLRLWTEDLSAQVKDYLAEKYPGQDMSRVAESLMQRFTLEPSLRQIHSHNHGQNQRRGIGT